MGVYTARMNARIASLVVALSLAACGGDSLEVSDQPLAGTIGGMPWTFVAGETDGFLSEGEDDFFTSLYAEAITSPCGFGSPSGNSLIVSIPKAPGDYDFSTSRNGTFVVGSDNLVTFEGRVIVHHVTATEVAGGLHMVFDGDNEVDGQFTATICPP